MYAHLRNCVLGFFFLIIRFINLLAGYVDSAGGYARRRFDRNVNTFVVKKNGRSRIVHRRGWASSEMRIGKGSRRYNSRRGRYNDKPYNYGRRRNHERGRPPSPHEDFDIDENTRHGDSDLNESEQSAHSRGDSDQDEKDHSRDDLDMQDEDFNADNVSHQDDSDIDSISIDEEYDGGADNEQNVSNDERCESDDVDYSSHDNNYISGEIDVHSPKSSFEIDDNDDASEKHSSKNEQNGGSGIGTCCYITIIIIISLLLIKSHKIEVWRLLLKTVQKKIKNEASQSFRNALIDKLSCA